jgi:hypothetical protein
MAIGFREKLAAILPTLAVLSIVSGPGTSAVYAKSCARAEEQRKANRKAIAESDAPTDKPASKDRTRTEPNTVSVCIASKASKPPDGKTADLALGAPRRAGTHARTSRLRNPIFCEQPDSLLEMHQPAYLAQGPPAACIQWA